MNEWLKCIEETRLSYGILDVEIYDLDLVRLLSLSSRLALSSSSSGASHRTRQARQLSWSSKAAMWL